MDYWAQTIGLKVTGASAKFIITTVNHKTYADQILTTHWPVISETIVYIKWNAHKIHLIQNQPVVEIESCKPIVALFNIHTGII